jgi:hypothetical protein
MAEEIIKVKVDLDVTEFSKNAKAMSDALSKILGKEVEIFNGRINKTAKLVENTEKALGGAAIAANKAGNSIKQSNQQWTSLALVIQDLPFGFRGIQNNLPALAAGVAGFAGPAYLAFSALVAAITAYDMGLFGAKKTTDDYAKSVKDLNKEIKDSTNYSTSNISVLNSLINIGTNLNNSEATRKKALIEIKDILGQVNKEEANRITNMGQAILAVNLYTEALKAQQLQEVSGKKIAELQMGLIEKRDELEKKRRINERQINPLKPFFGDKDVQNLETEIINTEALIRKLEQLNEGAVKANLSNPFANFNKPATGTAPKIEDNTIALLKSRQQYYKDNILMFASFEQEILKREEELAVKQAQAEGKSGKYIKGIRAKFAQDRINSAKEVSDKLDAIQAKLGEEEGKELQKRIDDAQRVSRELKVIDDRNLQNSLDALRLESDVRTKILNRTNKSDTEGRIKILEDYKNKLYDLASIGGYTEDQLDKINDAIVRIDASIEASKPVLKTYESNWTDTTNQIFDAVNNLVEGLITQLGQNLGKALAGENIDVLGGFGEQIGGALEEIGKALIAYGVAIKAFQLAQSNPYAAIAAGFALVVAGAALKSKFGKAQAALGGGSGGGFGNANSNTTSGAFGARPSFGLLGQSPNSTTGSNMSSIDNAQNMSNNSATFVLKGQDLLLSVNRAQKASQLKGQNINLAG